MGNIPNNEPTFLVLNRNNEIVVKNSANSHTFLNTLRWYIDYSFERLDFKLINRHDQYSLSYYKEISLQRESQPKYLSKASNHYWIFAAYYLNTNHIIPETLRISLLHNLFDQLIHDEEIKYDIKYCETGKYQHKNRNKRIHHSLISQYKNGAFIHYLIDPNKMSCNISSYNLWIPTIFDCTTYTNISDYMHSIKHVNSRLVIKSPILGLDYVKYSNLYSDIASIFKIIIQPMFEDCLGHKLGKEKIIIQSVQYLLNKPHDYYREYLHRIGMGESIISVAYYYPQISSPVQGMNNIQIKLSLNKLNKDKEYSVNIKEGSCIVFSNEINHKLCGMRYNDDDDDIDQSDDLLFINKSNQSPISVTVISFYLISPFKWTNILSTKDNGLDINLRSNWIHILRYWIRQIMPYYNGSNKITRLIKRFLFGKTNDYDEYVYNNRDKMKNRNIFVD